MRGRIAAVLCALASGAILAILVLGTRAPLGQVVRQEVPDVKDRVADDPDSWRDNLWKIADDLHERTKRVDQAGEEMIDRQLDVKNAVEAVEEVRLTEEIAQMALKTYTEQTAPRRTKDLQEEIAHADGLLKLAKAYLKAEEEKPKPDTDVGVAERNWYHYNAEKAQFTLDKAKAVVEVFKNYESKKEMFALRRRRKGEGRGDRGKTQPLESRGEGENRRGTLESNHNITHSRYESERRPDEGP